MSPRVPEVDFSMKSLNRIGDAFREGTAEASDFATLNSWRKLNSAELSNVRSTLNGILKGLKLSSKPLVSQRLKRLPTIISKLNYYPKMRFSAMQDIAGIRIVFKNTIDLSSFLQRVSQPIQGFKVVKDYIQSPSESGYRSIHLVKKLKSKVQVELQLRTELQHTWATAVEISDVLFREEGEYKRDSNIQSDRSELFRRISGQMRLFEEGKSLDPQELERIRVLEIQTELSKKVLEYTAAYDKIDRHLSGKSNRGTYWLIELKQGVIYLAQANEAGKSELIDKYTQSEEDGKEVVMVKADDLSSLKKAYPNYLGNASQFSEFVQFITATAGSM